MAKTRGVYEKPPGSGVWWCLYYLNGDRHRERAGRKSDAIALYQKRKTEFRLGKKLPELSRSKTTFAQVIDLGIAYAGQHNRDLRTFRSKGALLKASFGPRDAAAVTAEELAEWLRKRRVSNATFNRYKAFLSRCFREAAKLVPTNVAKDLKRRRESTGRKRYLSHAEYPGLVSTIEELHPDKLPRFTISVFSGMRLGEQFTLEWSQVDFDRDIINLTLTKNGDDRDVPMHARVRETLLELRGTKAGKRGKVFPRTGANIDQMDWFRPCLEAAGIHHYTWHNNRHTYCSWLALAGVPLLTIKELAGHKAIATTVRYAHLSPDHRAQELQKLTEPQMNVVQFRAG